MFYVLCVTYKHTHSECFFFLSFKLLQIKRKEKLLYCRELCYIKENCYIITITKEEVVTKFYIKQIHN